MSAYRNQHQRNLNLDQFGVLPTRDLGLQYHDLSEPVTREYDNSEADEKTRIRQPVDISSLHTVQYSVNRDRVKQKIEGKGVHPPQVLKVNGRNWIEDGHHNIAAAIARGETRIQADVALTDRASSSSRYEVKHGRGL